MASLSPDIYRRLHAVAQRHFAHRPGHTLQPTALVHEAFLKLAATDPERFVDSAHFTAIAITAMRQIMVDHARTRTRAKRGGAEQHRVTLSGLADGDGPDLVDVIGLDAALTALAALDARQAKVIELRFFGGLTVPEIATVIEISAPTVERDLRKAKAWLHMTLGASDP